MIGALASPVSWGAGADAGSFTRDRLERWALFPQIAGGIEVIISVAYLGLQIADNTKLLRSQAHFNALSLAQRPLEVMVEDEGLAASSRPKSRSQSVTDPRYAAFAALNPFFEIVQQGLAGMVDGDHYFDTVADEAIFEFRYDFPGFPREIEGRDALMALYSGYGDNIILHGADALVVHRSRAPGVVIIEYEVHGKAVATGAVYDNRFISVVTIEHRKITRWRDYMDSLAAMTALTPSG